MTARWIQVLGLCLGMFFPSLALAELAAKPLPPAPAVWAAALAEPLPPALAQALAGKVRFVEAGPIQKAAEQVVATRAALASLRCSEVMPSLRKAGEALLDEVPVALAQPIARELFGLMLPKPLKTFLKSKKVSNLPKKNHKVKKIRVVQKISPKSGVSSAERKSMVYC